MQIGDLVKIKYIMDQVYVGVLVDIREKREIFSEKYGVTHTATYLYVLCNDNIEVLDKEDCIVQVINEDR